MTLNGLGLLSTLKHFLYIYKCCQASMSQDLLEILGPWKQLNRGPKLTIIYHLWQIPWPPVQTDTWNQVQICILYIMCVCVWGKVASCASSSSYDLFGWVNSEYARLWLRLMQLCRLGLLSGVLAVMQCFQMWNKRKKKSLLI